MKVCFLWLLLGVLSVSADTNLVTSKAWRVDGADDTGPNPHSIKLVVDKLPAGAFSELKVYFEFGRTNREQVFSVTGEGVFRPIVPPPVVPGGAIRLTSYRDCDAGLVPPMAITDLEFKTPRGSNVALMVKGRLSNFDSLAATDFKLKFYTPLTNEVVAEVRYQLKATRDICVDHTLDVEQDEFRLAQIEANFVSPATNQNTRLRYTRVTDVICDPYTGCHISRKSFCADLDGVVGYLLGKPRLLGDATVLLLHTNAVPQNTPTLAVSVRSPAHHHVKPQAFVVPTDDPTEPNVTLWLNWVDAKKAYKRGQGVAGVRLLLGARDPNNPGCDEIKTPAP